MPTSLRLVGINCLSLTDLPHPTRSGFVLVVIPASSVIGLTSRISRSLASGPFEKLSFSAEQMVFFFSNM